MSGDHKREWSPEELARSAAAWEALREAERPSGMRPDVWLKVPTVLSPLCWCSRFGWDRIWPGQEWIAQRLGVERHSVANVLAAAEKHGLVVRHRNPLGNRYSYRYELLFVPAAVRNLGITPPAAPTDVDFSTNGHGGIDVDFSTNDDVDFSTNDVGGEVSTSSLHTQNKNDHHHSEAGGGGGGRSLEETDHNPDERGLNCRCGLKHNEWVQPCLVCNLDVEPRLSGVWTAAGQGRPAGPWHLRCKDDPDWPERESRERFRRMMDAATAEQQAEEEGLAALRATARAQAAGEQVVQPVHREQLEELMLPALRTIATEDLGIELPPRGVRGQVMISLILEALGSPQQPEHDEPEHDDLAGNVLADGVEGNCPDPDSCPLGYEELEHDAEADAFQDDPVATPTDDTETCLGDLTVPQLKELALSLDLDLLPPGTPAEEYIVAILKAEQHDLGALA